MAYWRLHYHLVWTTYQRAPRLTKQLEGLIYGAVLGKAAELGIIVHAIGGNEDHIHLVASIPPKIAVADCVRLLKGSSSHYVNHQVGAPGNFGWQEGYGALTFSEEAVPKAVTYVRNQKEHHRHKTMWSTFEQTSDEDNGVHIAVA